MNDAKKIGSFPSPLLPKEEKKKDSYGLQVGRAIEGSWFDNQSYNFSKQQKDIQERRSYAYGKQNIDRYKARINPSGDNSYYNLDFSPVAIAPKFVSSIVSAIYDNKFEIEVKAIDPLALSQKEAYKNDLVGKIINKPYLDELKEQFGLDMLQGQELPETVEEVDLHMNLNFKQSVEIAAEIAIRYAFKINDYDEEIKRKIIEDIVVIGKGVSLDITDPIDGIKLEYIDPEYWVHSATRRQDFKDCFYMGHIEYMTIAKLRRQAASRGAEWANNEKDLEKIAKMYVGELGNPTTFDYTYNNNVGYYPYDDYLIPVLRFEYKVSDMDKYEEKETKYGTTTFKKKPSGYKPPKKSKYNRKQYEDKYEDIYAGYYVLKTDKVYGWGRLDNQVRPDDALRKCEFSYTAYAPELYKNDTSSIIGKIMPYLDAIQLSWLKMQVVMQNSAPDGYAIDLSALDAVDLGNGALDPMTIEDIRQATGRLFYRSMNEDQSRNSVPVMPMRNQLDVSPFINQIEFNLRMIREISGVVPEMDGQTKRDQLVGVTEISIQSAKNSISYIDNSIRSITRRVAEKSIMRIQDLPKGSALYKEYMEAVGQANMAVVDAMGDLSIHKFGIDISVGRNDVERLSFERDVTAMVNAGMITPDERYFILRITNTNYAAAYLKMTREKREARKLEEDKARIREQSMANAQAAQAAEQAKAMAAQAIAQYELQKEIQLLNQVKMPEMNLQFQYDAQLQQIKNTGSYNQAQVSAMAKAAVEAEKEDRKDQRSEKEATQQGEIAYRKEKNLPPKDFTEEEMFKFDGGGV